MILGYKREPYCDLGITIPVRVTLPKKYTHLLLSGKSGSGKSLTGLWYIWQILYKHEGLLWISDFKGGEEYEALEGSHNYASGQDAVDMIHRYYEFFCAVRQNRIRLPQYHALFIEEWMGLLTWMEVKEPKEKKRLMAETGEILALGRGLNCGLILTIQRADAAMFSNGSREQFQCIINLGRCSSEAFKMLGFAAAAALEENPTASYKPGEGLALIDGQGDVEEIIVPKINNSGEMLRQIRYYLDREPDLDSLAREAATGSGPGL